MPRQDVPYGGAICHLRERIAEIFDKLGEKLHTINGVPGDGDGNVKIVSGSSAVVISNDPTQNKIAVSLDTSQLPAASVASVNGQTGAVAITADDIPSDNGDVQTDLDNLEAADTTLQGNINAEALARQGADSTLQTNINNITASLPSQVVAAVAADPTIALLVSADSDNVKLTGNQSIGGIKTVNTEATRTYSQQIANSQKVKNELDNYIPMVRTANNQTIGGVKTFTSDITINKGLPLIIEQWQTGSDSSPPPANRDAGISFRGVDGIEICSLYMRYYPSGTTELRCKLRNADGTHSTIVLASGSP